MTEKPGEALTVALKKREQRRGNLNAARNAARAKEHVYFGELSQAELLAERDRLKRETRDRHPDWGWID